MTATDEINDSQPKHCLNCGKELVDEYCQRCGQPADTERYSLQNFSHETYKNLRKIDITATAKTFWELLARPGAFVREYFAGKRVGFVHPVKFFVYGYLLELLVRNFLAWATGDQILATVLRGEGILFQLIDLLAIAFWGLMWPLFYRDEELNLAEFALSALILHSQTVFLSVVLLIVTLPIRELVPGSLPYLVAVKLLLDTVYMYYFAIQLFSHEPKWKVFLKQSVLYAIIALLAYPVMYADELIR